MLIQKRIDELEELKKQEKKHAKFQMVVSQQNQDRVTKIKWIQKGILETPPPDHRKYIIWRILSPYMLKKGYLPISLEKLKEENKALYDIVIAKDDVPSEPS